jgi:molybdopterin-guanine dinucleotide biosynthesis protein A
MSQSDALFIVAGDMPYLERNVIENLTFQFNKLIPQALVPRHSGFIEPLHSIYNAEIEPLLVKMLTTSDNASVISLLEQIDTRYLDVEPSVAVRAFHNINSSDDLRRI